MQNREGRLGQIGRYWLSRRRNSAAWCRTWFDAATRQTCRASLGTEDLDEAKLALAAWITSSIQPDQSRPEDAPLETYLVRYLERHAKYLPSAEPARYGLVRWSEFFAGALVSEITPERQREFVEFTPRWGAERWLYPPDSRCGTGGIEPGPSRRRDHIGTADFAFIGSRGRAAGAALGDR